MKRKNTEKKPEIFTETNVFWKLVGNLPVTLGLSLAAFGSVCILLLLLESFRTNLILGIGIPVLLLFFVYSNRLISPESVGSIRERRIVDIIAILLIIGWGVFNSSYNAQTIYLYRDPGLYNTTARWLMDHDNIVIPSNNPFGDNDQLRTTSNAGVNMLKEDDSRLYTHGQRLLPTLTATIGRVTQEAAALKTNVAIGAMALLTLYGFTRLFIKPRWALLTTSVFSLSLPMLYFSRDMYTEPMSMLFFFTMLILLYYAKRTDKPALWLLSGFVAGAITMTRIDAYLGLAGILVYFLTYLILAKKNYRKTSLYNISLFLLGLLITAIIAWIDLTQLGTSYYRFQQSLIEQQFIVLISIFLLGTIFVTIAWKTKILLYLSKKSTLKMLKSLSILFIFISSVFLFLRPLFIKGTRFYEVQNIAGTESIINLKSWTVNSVSYDLGERVLLWPIWYLGLMFCLAGLAGLIILVKKIWDDKSLLTLPFLFSFLSVTLLYLYRPAITPDQVWASRRLLPVVLPGVSFLCAYLLSSIKFKNKIPNSLYFILASFLLVYPIYSTSKFFIKEKVNDPLLTYVNQFCNVLPENSAVLLIGNFGLVGTQTINSYCGIPTVRYIGISEPTQTEFKDFYSNAVLGGYTPVVASFYEDRPLFTEGSRVRDLSVAEYQTVEKVFQKIPEKMVSGEKQITLGILNYDGVVRQRMWNQDKNEYIILNNLD